MSLGLEYDVDLLIARVDKASKAALVDLFTFAVSEGKIEMLLCDILTERELRRVHNRIRAIFAVFIARATGMPHTKVCAKGHINFQTYEKAMRLLSRTGKSKKLFQEIANKHFPELREAGLGKKLP